MASIGDGAFGAVTIGVDPHPGSHTAAALTADRRVIGHLTVVNDLKGLRSLREWANQFRDRRWAIEGAGNHFVLPLVAELLADGEVVYSIPPAMTAQYRRRRSRCKDDQIDAENAARALLANPDLPPHDPMHYERRLKELTRTYMRLSSQLKASRMAVKSTEIPEVRLALDRVIVALVEAIDALKQAMKVTVEAIAPQLLATRGVGPVVASVVLAEAGRIARFKDRDRFVAYGGCAPIRWESGAHQTVRVNAGGNRRLNWATHIVVTSRLRIDPRTQRYRDKKLAEGKTQREVIRLLKTYVSRELFKTLRDVHIGLLNA
jgi:transposase